MQVDEKLVGHLSSLARLKLDETKMPQYVGKLQSVLSYMEQLATLEDSLGDDWRADTIQPSTPQRDDANQPSISSTDFVANAPEVSGTSFRVPQVIE